MSFLPEKCGVGPFRFKRLYGPNHEGVWSPFLSKVTFRLAGWSIGIHKFHRGDADPDCHDHPFDFWTFPLTSYVEEVIQEQTSRVFVHDGMLLREYDRVRILSVVKRFRIHYRAAEYTHRVLYALGYPPADKKTIWTIIVKRDANREWGFLKHRDGRWCWQDWKSYVNQGGRDVGCNE